MLALHYGKSRTPLAWVVPDDRYPSMFRIRWPDGSLSDMVNLSRAKDAAMAFAVRQVGQRDVHFNWKRTGTAAEAPPMRSWEGKAVGQPGPDKRTSDPPAGG